MTDKEIIDLLGLTDRTIQVGVSIEDDLQYLIENGIEKYNEELQKREEMKKWFLSLFKDCYDDLCVYMEQDPKRRVSVNCRTCIKGMNLRDQYGTIKK